MNEKTINEQYTYIRSLLEEKRLKEALMQLESALAMSGLGFTYPLGAAANLLQVYAGVYAPRRKRPRTLECIQKTRS